MLANLNKPLFIVGLTGGIGSGKSTVADQLVAAGAELVDTDRIAHELTQAGGAAIPDIRRVFGAAMIDADGALLRKAMRQRVFSDPAAKASLESILHPLIRSRAREALQQLNAAYAVLAVPLLVESAHWREACDRILVVDCPEALQIARVMKRSGLSAEEVRAIMATQATRTQRIAIADDVIDNGGDFDSLRGQLAALHARYLAAAREKAGGPML